MEAEKERRNEASVMPVVTRGQEVRGQTGRSEETEEDAESSSSDEDIVEHPRPASNVSTPPTVQPCNPEGPESWSQDYLKSPFWGQMWRDTRDPTKPWPQDVKVQSGRLLYKGQVAIPEAKV